MPRMSKKRKKELAFFQRKFISVNDRGAEAITDSAGNASISAGRVSGLP